MWQTVYTIGTFKTYMAYIIILKIDNSSFWLIKMPCHKQTPKMKENENLPKTEI